MANKKENKKEGKGKKKFAADRRRAEELVKVQQVSLNIIEDLEKRGKELEESQNASLNIMEDLDRAYKELQASAEREKELAAAAATAEADRKRASELEKAYKDLENADKELKDATAQLVQSEKLSSLGELTAGIVHELNQPLNSIKIVCQSMLRDIKKERYKEEDVELDLRSMLNQVDKMTDIIDHMRIFTRRTVGMPREEVDVSILVEGAFKFIGQQLKDRNIGVKRELSPDLPKPIGDPIRLEQVVLNLITNARNAVESSGKEDKRIEIRTYKIDKQQSPIGGPAVVVEVADNGLGVPEHLREKIFEPFFTTSKPGEGTGLGLSVAQRIIEEHKGKIELESKVGEGSIFRVILPVSRIGEHK